MAQPAAQQADTGFMESHFGSGRLTGRVLVALSCAVVPSAIMAATSLLRLTANEVEAVVGLGFAGGTAGFAYLNTKVGYRWFDIARTLIPVYGAVHFIRVLYRGVSLPDDYWAPYESVNEAYRVTAVNELVSTGVARHVATAVALGLFPIDDEFEPNPAFEEAIYDCALKTAARVQETADEDLAQLGMDTLTDYINVAKDHGELYYVDRYGYSVDECRAVATAAQRNRFGQLERDPDQITPTHETVSQSTGLGESSNEN